MKPQYGNLWVLLIMAVKLATALWSIVSTEQGLLAMAYK
jgi:hypothetical protein